ncbi:MAG: DUF2007 domain-containing protein [Gammaproteobacteria bacterium]|nr:DUF2007 domain-containing protein [Gammaproteobacteria bacterium]
MKLIYKASDINEANIVSGMLRANGIEAHVGGFYLQGGVGDLAAMDFATIHVPDEDVELARSLIAEYESVPVIKDASAVKRKRANFLSSIILFVIIIIVIYYYSVG